LPVAAGTSAGSIVSGSRATLISPSGEISGFPAGASPGNDPASRRNALGVPSAVRQTTSTVSDEVAGKRDSSASDTALDSEPGVL